MLGEDNATAPIAPACPTPGGGRVQAMAARSPSKPPAKRYERYVSQQKEPRGESTQQDQPWGDYNSPSRSSRDYNRTADEGGGGDDQDEYREERLVKVFAVFDMDGDGSLTNEELLALGMARRKLGQKDTNWNAELTARLVSNIKGGRRGGVTQSEFVSYFVDMLPKDRSEFDTTIKEFLLVARETKQKNKSSSNKGPASGSSSGSGSAAPGMSSSRMKKLENMEPYTKRKEAVSQYAQPSEGSARYKQAETAMRGSPATTNKLSTEPAPKPFE